MSISIEDKLDEMHSETKRADEDDELNFQISQESLEEVEIEEEDSYEIPRADEEIYATTNDGDDDDAQFEEIEEEEEEDSSSVLQFQHGLDPMATELISSSNIQNDNDFMNDLQNDDEDGVIIPKISREVKNLQITTNDAQANILSSLLLDSPRKVKKVIKDLTPDDVVEEDEKSSDKDEHSKSPSEERLAVSSSSDSHRDSIKSNGKAKSHMKILNKKRKRSEVLVREELLSGTSDKEETNDDDEKDEIESSCETSSISIPMSMEGRSVNQPPKPGWDSFCFKCHSDSAVLSLPCSRCKCSYHRHCVRPNPIPKNVVEFLCPECREIETAENATTNKYGHERIETKKLAELLIRILSKLLEGPIFEEFKNDVVLKTKESAPPLIVNNMSFSLIESRISNNYYATTELFIHDLKQLEHNWSILDRNKAKALKPIIKTAVSEVNELESCVYCYEDSLFHPDWFVRVCKRPHLLVWAKLKGYPYWPAKIMSIDSQRQQADVRFFGAHDRAWIQTIYCMIFCEKDPNKSKETSTPTVPKMASKTQKSFLEAIKEKDEYIENLNTVYGFRYAPTRTMLDGNNLQGHLEAMLPKIHEVKDAQQKEKLTLKLVKRQSSNKYQVENRKLSTSSNSRDKAVYKVVSKDENDEDLDTSKKLQIIISKSKRNSDQENEKSAKKPKTGDNNLETPVEAVNPKPLLTRKVVQKRGPKVGKKKILDRNKKIRKSVDVKVPVGTDEIKELKDHDNVGEKTKNIIKPLLPPPAIPPAIALKNRKRAQSTFHRSNSVDRETQKSKLPRRMSVTFDTKMHKGIEIVKASLPATRKTRSSAIEKVVEDIKPKTPELEKGRKRGRKPRTDEDKAAVEGDKKARVEADSKKKKLEDEKKVPEETAVPEKPRRFNKIKTRESTSSLQAKEIQKPVEETEPVFKEPSPEIFANGCEKDVANVFDPKLVIKNEPVSDTEDSNTEVESLRSYTFRDIPNLITDKAAGKKLIVISTEENEISKGRARKSFVNNVNARQAEKLTQNKNESWMVSIPKDITSGQSSRAHSPANSNSISNRSTPVSADANTIGNSQINQNLNHSPSLSNGNIVNFNHNSATENPSSSRRSSTQISPNSVRTNCLPPPPQQQQPQIHQIATPTNSRSQDMPRLVPRPQGVFLFDGTSFTRDVGPVSRMFNDNAHRITDFFRSVLIDTVSSFAPEYPTAENVMLRSENEKLLRDMQTVKSDCQTKMQELRKEHEDEMETIKRTYEEKITSIQNNYEQEKKRLRQEIRQQCEVEKQRAIEVTKKDLKNTTWCASCKKEARFYCCWNTSYCGTGCQKMHWHVHQKTCSNKNSIQDSQQPIQQQQIQQQQLQHQQQLQQQQQQIQLQQIHESQIVHHQLPQIQNTTTNNHRQGQLIVKSPQQLQQSIQGMQHIIIPQRAPPLQPTIIQPQPKIVINPPSKTVVFQEKINPQNMLVHVVPNESGSFNMISVVSPSEFNRANSTISTVTSTTTGQE